MTVWVSVAVASGRVAVWVLVGWAASDDGGCVSVGDSVKSRDTCVAIKSGVGAEFPGKLQAVSKMSVKKVLS